MDIYINIYIFYCKEILYFFLLDETYVKIKTNHLISLFLTYMLLNNPFCYFKIIPSVILSIYTHYLFCIYSVYLFCLFIHEI